MKKKTIGLIIIQSILIISLFYSVPSSVSLIAPKVEWSRTYEISAPIDVEGQVAYSQSGRSLIETFDGGFAIVGKTIALFGGVGLGGRGPSSERDGGVLIKTNSEGVLQWYTAFPFEPNYPNSIIQTNDFGFLVSCRANLLKFDSDGAIQWNKDLGISILRMFSSNDNTYVLSGVASSDYDEEKGLLLRIDGNGEVLMNNTFTDYLPTGENLDNNSLSKHNIFDIISTGNGGYVLIGTWSDSGAWSFKTNLWLVEVDNTDTMILNRTYNLFNVPSYSPLSESVFLSSATFHRASQGDFVLSGRCSSDDFYAPWFARIDSSGNLVFSKTYANSWWNSSYFYSSVDDQNNGYFAVGVLGPGLGYSNSQIYPLLLGADDLGNEEWRLTYHSSWWNSNSGTLNGGDAVSVVPLFGGNFAVAGTVNGRVWMTKITIESTSVPNEPASGISVIFLIPTIITVAVAAIVTIVILQKKCSKAVFKQSTPETYLRI